MFKNIKKFKKTYIGLFIVLVIAIIGFNFSTLKEGLTNNNTTNLYKSCSGAPKNCADCINAQIIDEKPNPITGKTCYWSTINQTCGSFDDEGTTQICGPDSDDKCRNISRAKCITTSGCDWDWDIHRCQSEDNPLPPPSPPPGPSPGPGPGPVADKCSNKQTQIGCNMTNGCDWNNGKCGINSKKKLMIWTLNRTK
jgi:hypothetical protein